MGKHIAIVVVVDGLRADGLACYGNARAETPFLDRLAAESVVFDFAYCERARGRNQPGLNLQGRIDEARID